MGLIGFYRVVTLAACIGLLTAQAVAAASPILQLTNHPASDVRPALSPDGRTVAFQSNRSGAYRIYLVGVDGGNERVLGTGQADDRHPAWRPDGAMIAVDSGSEGLREIWTIDLASGARTQVTRLAAIASFPSWSPDGSRLSFYVYQNGELNLWTVEANGGNPRQITQGLASERRSQCTFACHAASWSPDGQRIAYAAASDPHVWSVRADGSDPQRISPTGFAGRNHFPTYLPDGRVLYVEEHITPGQSWTDVWVIQPGGVAQRESVLQDVQAQGPFNFSQDMGRLLFASPRSGNFDIYLVDLSTEGKEALKIKSAETAPAPGLAPRSGASHPAEIPMGTGGAAGAGAAAKGAAAATPAPAGATAAQTAQAQTGGFQAALPFLAAVGVLGLAWVGVEIVMMRRKRRVHGR